MTAKERKLSERWLFGDMSAARALSYSLYLVHDPVGGRVVNFGRRFSEEPEYQFGLSAFALAVSIAFAVAFKALVERPGVSLARRLLSQAAGS
jgi:peptidoglycan/LPS O-acetylase OafA/YrhL